MYSIGSFWKHPVLRVRFIVVCVMCECTINDGWLIFKEQMQIIADWFIRVILKKQ